MSWRALFQSFAANMMADARARADKQYPGNSTEDLAAHKVAADKWGELAEQFPNFISLIRATERIYLLGTRYLPEAGQFELYDSFASVNSSNAYSLRFSIKDSKVVFYKELDDLPLSASSAEALLLNDTFLAEESGLLLTRRHHRRQAGASAPTAHM